MKTPVLQALKSAPCLIFSIIFILLFVVNSCKKDDTNLRPLEPLIAEAKSYFDTQIATQPEKPIDDNPRHQVAKKPLWNKAYTKTISIGQAVIVPLEYSSEIFTKVGKNQDKVYLKDISYLMLYKDKQGKFHAEVVTRMPDDAYWDSGKAAGKNFSGIVMVEDWWGKTVKKYLINTSGKINHLNNSVIIGGSSGLNPEPRERLSLHAPAELCFDKIWIITATDSQGHVLNRYTETETNCFPVDSGGGGGGDGGGGNPGGGGTGPGDYENRPPGGGGGGRRENNPPAPPNERSDITNNVTDPCLKRVVQDLKLARLTDQMSKIISLLDKETHIKINVRDSIRSRNGKPANSFGFRYFEVQGKAFFEATILLNRETLLENSIETVTTVILHELIHSYFNYINKVPKLEIEIEHEEMAQNYVKPMAEFLSTLYNISLKDATALAWSGLPDTKSYKDSNLFNYSDSPGDSMTKAEMERIHANYASVYSGRPICSEIGVE